jgi:uncharacterized protein YqeY
MKELLLSDIKNAMKSGDKKELMVLRGLLSAIKNEEIKERNENLSNQVLYSIVKKQVKQRNESIDAYTKANRLDLVETEEYEKRILEEYLPTQVSEEDTKLMVLNVIKDLNVTSINDIGKVMKEIKSKNIDNIDMGLVNKFVKELLV